jgi:hypothetical protein
MHRDYQISGAVIDDQAAGSPRDQLPVSFRATFMSNSAVRRFRFLGRTRSADQRALLVATPNRPGQRSLAMPPTNRDALAHFW